METIPFVDAHMHLWDLSHLDYPWLLPPFDDIGPNGSTEKIAVNYGVDDYQSDLVRWDVRGAVHIDAGAAPDQALAETQWLEDQGKHCSLPTAIIAYAALEAPNIDDALSAQASYGRVKGIRQIVNWHPDPTRTYTPNDLTLDDEWWRGFGRLATFGLSFDLQCYAHQMSGLAPLIARHPDIPVIINHLGMPIPEGEGLIRWRHGIRTLAAYSHVSIKISGLGFIFRDWTLDAVTPLLHEAVDTFGPDRCMFASDSPTDKLFAPIDRYLEAYHAFAAEYSDAERRDMFGRNANRIYRLGLSL